jgi:nucleoid DNA-binding protein
MHEDKRYFSDMVREIRVRTDVEKYVVEKVLKAFLEILTEWLLQKLEFNWLGFCIFKTKTSKGYVAKTLRTVLNPSVTEERYVPERTTPITQYSPQFKKKFRGEDNA